MNLTDSQNKIKQYLTYRDWVISGNGYVCEVFVHQGGSKHCSARMSILDPSLNESPAWMIDPMGTPRGKLVTGNTFAEFVVAYLEYTEASQ
jgi:hypothetical protein